MDGILIKDDTVVGVVGGLTTVGERAEQLAFTIEALAIEQAKEWPEGSRQARLQPVAIARMQARIAALSAPPPDQVADWPQDAVFDERSTSGVKVGDAA